MNYVGVDWAYGRASFCAMSKAGSIESEGLIPADEDGLARLVLRLGVEVTACVEMMSGALWVKDRLELGLDRTRCRFTLRPQPVAVVLRRPTDARGRDR